MLELFLSISEPLSCARGCCVTLDVHTHVLHLLIHRLAQMESEECSSPGVPKPMGWDRKSQGQQLLEAGHGKCPSAEPGAGKFLLLLLLLGVFSLELQFGEHSSGFEL